MNRAKFLNIRRTEIQTVVANRISLPVLRLSLSGVLNSGVLKAGSSEGASQNEQLVGAESPERAINSNAGAVDSFGAVTTDVSPNVVYTLNFVDYQNTAIKNYV